MAESLTITEYEQLREQVRLAIDQGNLHLVNEIKADLISRFGNKLKSGLAAEMSRRCDRAAAQLVRRGQHPPDKYIHAQGDGRPDDIFVDSLRFFTSTQDRQHCYQMFDNVTEEQFEDALAKAQEERNLSRSNVARICAGKNAEEIMDPRSRKRPEVLRRTHHHKTDRVIGQAINTIEGVTIGLQVLEDDDLKEITAEDAKAWASSLQASITKLNHLRRALNDVRFQ